MRQRKLQVFLSSTYSDLVDERLAAMEAILAAGHIPAAMEQFTPGDEEAWEKITRWIDNSDCYILILGGRYGSIEPTSGKSYTQLEYEYALEQKKPFMSIVMNDAVLDRKVKEGRKHTDLTEQVEPQLYKDFKALVTTKHCAFWSDTKDIKSEIYRKLPDWYARDDLKGWVRAEEAASPEAMNELARLSRENDELRQRLSASAEKFDGLSFEEMVPMLREDRRIGKVHVESGHNVLASFPNNHIFIHENAGHLFDLCMESLSSTADNYFYWKIKGAKESILIVYEFDVLARHGLANKVSGSSYKLTEMGRRFRNRLLTYGDRQQLTRFRELWGVELADEETVQQER